MDAKQTAIQLNPAQLRKLQMEMLDLLVEFDRICRKHNIRYFLSGGTLLGAIRHQGFIPWDDDVDVELLRKDYQKFCEVCENEIFSKKFFFQTYENDEHYNWVYGKMRLKNTAYIREGQSHLNQKTGICIDVFPIDNISSNPIIQRMMEWGTGLCRKVLWAPVGAVQIQSILKRFIFKLLSFIPRRLALTIYGWIVSRYKDKVTSDLGFFGLSIRNSRGYSLKLDWYKNAIENEFEGRKFFIPEGYHDILHFYYDNYMEWPNIKDRHGNCPAEYIKFSDGTELEK